jgi:alkaline phosphatase
MKRNPNRASTAILACALLAGAAEAVPAADSARPRSAVLVLADGMGWGHLQLWRDVARLEGRASALETLWKDGRLASVELLPPGELVPESAGAASIFATGEPVANAVVSMTPDGRPLPTLLEKARAGGRATGLVTTGRVTHAVPAAFLSHAAFRDPESALAEAVVAGADVLLGGGASTVPDRVLAGVRRRGGRVLRTAKDLKALRAPPAVGLFSDDYFPFALDRGPSPAVPSLEELVSAALRALAADPDGFVLVVDARLIDEASHVNDAAAMLAEMEELDRALAAALAFARERKDVLVLVTSPHDTGGPAAVSAANPLDWTARETLRRVRSQKDSFRALFADLWRREEAGRPADAASVRECAAGRLPDGNGLTDEDFARVAQAFREGPKSSPFECAPASARLAEALAPFYRVRWLTGMHTGSPVPSLAWGPGADSFTGGLSARDLSQRLTSLLGL